jgi:hypothetical protein
MQPSGDMAGFEFNFMMMWLLITMIDLCDGPASVGEIVEHWKNVAEFLKGKIKQELEKDSLNVCAWVK